MIKFVAEPIPVEVEKPSISSPGFQESDGVAAKAEALSETAANREKICFFMVVKESATLKR
jgi:hypothetical protein